VVRGFDVERYLPGLHTPADTLVDVMLESIGAGGGRSPQGPRFAYVHFLDAHGPYERSAARGAPFDRYLASLAIVDRAVGHLRRRLAALGLDRRTSIVLTADHGDGFGEHETWGHGVTVYEELIRVPLLVHVPGVAPRRVDRDVSLIDLGPTVLDLMGQPTPGTNMGESLVPFLRGEDSAPARPVAVETGTRARAMIFPDGVKVIEGQLYGTFELYDLRSDPGELRNLSGCRTVDVHDYLGQLDAYFYVHAPARGGGGGADEQR
jgi:arylsulfatase A-like enzyme